MKAEIYNSNGAHGLKINGKVYSFAATRSFRPEGRILHDFSEHGIKFFNIFPSGIMTALGNRTIPYSQFGPVWVGDHEYNWDNLRAQCDEFFSNIGEDTYVSISAHLDPPQWYVDSHPGLVDHWEQMIQNMGYEQWKKDAADYLCALVDKMDEWYPERVYAIFLLSGGTTEWYSYHADEVLEKPTELQQKAFREYMNDDSVSIPSPEVLHHAEDGFIRHPVIDKPAIDYWKFTNTIVPETIMYFAHVAKEHTHGTKLVGIFNSQSYGTMIDWAVRMAYINLDKLSACPDIDMMFCPASYIMRRFDSTSGIRVPVDSMVMQNKLFVHEIDSSTHLLKKSTNSTDNGAFMHAVGRDQTFTCTNDTKMYLRRETGIVLAKGMGYWWFDMFSGYYDDPELMQEITDIHSLQEELLKRGSHSVSEVIEMLDRNSALMLKTNSFYPMVEHQTPELNSVGAPWEQGDTFDLFLDNFETERYKLFIFPALFAPEKNLRDKIAELKKLGKNMLYMHAPGYVTDDGYSEASMKELTGITLKRIELEDNTIVGVGEFEGISYDFNNAHMKGDIWPNRGETIQVKPIFTAEDLDVVFGVFKENGLPAVGIKFRKDGGFDAFSACAPVPKEILAKIYEYAKIFRYTDNLEPIYTNDNFECAYSFTGGVRKLYRPVETIFTEYFTKEQYKVGPSGTEVTFNEHETKMFLVDKA